MNKAHHIIIQWIARQWQAFVGINETKEATSNIADYADSIRYLQAANNAIYQENLEHTPL